MAGEIIDGELSAVGVNANSRRTCVNNNANNPVIGLRSFSGVHRSPLSLPPHTSQACRSKRRNEQSTSGHGNVSTDSHTGLPSIDSTKEELYATELVPFQAAIDAGTDMIMTAHISSPTS
ncbi:MAG: glycoside hydrolase family 3 N-terminal domain-containing protein [Merdibacter sp.]